MLTGDQQLNYPSSTPSSNVNAFIYPDKIVTCTDNQGYIISNGYQLAQKGEGRKQILPLSPKWSSISHKKQCVILAITNSTIISKFKFRHGVLKKLWR